MASEQNSPNIGENPLNPWKPFMSRQLSACLKHPILKESQE